MLKIMGKFALAGAVVALSGCASFQQTKDDVYLREGGSLLKPWKSTAEASTIHLPYAWASVSAYLHEVDDKDITITDACPEPHAFLGSRGWSLWTELPRVGRLSKPSNDLEQKLKDAHLRAEVWENSKENTVIVAFGGTASLKDLGANARWFFSFGDPDAYEVLTADFLPEFLKAYKIRSNKPDGAWLKSAKIISTGHSLGGGLAQRFAYSLKPSEVSAKVHEVYAFDPSPVSGKRSVDGFEETAKGLTIYRIYNRGEFLAGIRSILQPFNWGNERNQGQTWIDIRYASGWGWRTLLPTGWLRAHGMHELACFIKDNAVVAEARP